MKRWICLPCVVIAVGQLHAQQSGWQPTPGHTQVPLWPGAVPDAPRGAAADAESSRAAPNPVAGKPWVAVYNVSRPTLTVYAPQGDNTGAAVLVFPGGGYNILAIDLEGTEVCDWLTAKGMTCVLLKYRVPRSGPQWDRKCRCEVNPTAPLALEDAQRTLSLVRFHAAEWHIDPHKIGVLGFSAGGHLSVAVSNAFDRRSYTAVDAADSVSCRPDFAVVLYPGHLWSPRARGEINADIHVTAHTPPTFLLQAGRPGGLRVEHDRVLARAPACRRSRRAACVSARWACVRTAADRVSHHEMAAAGGDVAGVDRDDLAVVSQFGWACFSLLPSHNRASTIS